jgi:cell division protein FtsN
MTAQRREVYQPSFDETPTYDLQDEEVEDARARLPLLIVIALLVLAAFAGVVWLAYNQGVESGRMGVPAIIAAPEGPVRTAPDQRQLAEEPITGLSVYQEPVAPEQEAAQSTLAAAPPPTELRPTEPAPVITEPEPAPPPAPVVIAAPAPEPAPPRPAPVPAAAPAPPPPAPVAVNTPPPAQVVAPAASSAMASAGAVLQLGSYPSEALANNAWTTFKEKHAAILGALSSDVQMANIPDRGTWYRLRAGPYTDRASAVAACEALRAEGGTCLVAQP